MKRTRLVVSTSVALVLGVAAAFPAQASNEPADQGRARVGRGWLDRLDPWLGIPQDLALPLARAAVAHGMTKGQVARLLNDERFAAAVGSGRGYAALDAMSRDPGLTVSAYELLFDTDRDFTSSGATSYQTALFEALPELRNDYLSDLGHMVVTRSDGVEVLIDIETGRQVVGQGRLGIQITAPGGGPLPDREAVTEEAITTLQGGMQRAGGNPFAMERPGLGSLGLDQGGDEEAGLVTPGLYVGVLLFAIPWLAYGLIAVARRLRPE